jgi:hypothetical protein
MNTNKKALSALSALFLAGALAACGGGGGSAGTTNTGGGGSQPGTNNPGTTTPVAASMIFDVSKPSLDNSGGDSVVLTVTGLDANNNPVAGLPLSVSVDSGVFTPGVTTSGNDGRAGGTITIGANKTNRNITATIRLGTQTATAVIPVVGGQISISPVPGTPAPGQSVRVDLKVADSTGAGVPNTDVTLSGTLGLTGTVRTDLNGNVTANLGAAPAARIAPYTIDVTALGIKATRDVQVISPSGGGIQDAVGPISSASLSIVPNTIAPNISGSTSNRASVRAKFINGANAAVQNVRVRFSIVQPRLDAGEQLSSGDAVVFSDVNGEAIADYIAGTRSSPTDGVKIRACYALTDAAIASGQCQPIEATLTVASQPLAITLGDNNELTKGASNLTYIKKFDVAVADAAGNAVPNAVVSASVDITHYGKGAFLGDYTTGINPPTLGNTFPTTVNPADSTGRVWCQNEDTNRNGAIDTAPVAEDINRNGKLEPRKADVILSFLGSNTTSANGRMQIQVEYPQNVATWLSYTVRVTTNVAGSEGTDSKSYITTFVRDDLDNGSFRTAPYGANACVDAN